MADETTSTVSPPTDASVTENPAKDSLANPEEGKLTQSVEITDAGPCKKHIKVSVDRKAIDERLNEKYTELVRSDSSPIAGFRPGKAPRKIIERRFKSAVMEQVRTEVLMASLEQIASDHQITPLAPPNLDPEKLEIPDSGPFIYEFDVEVRPEFDLPDYKGMTLKRVNRVFKPEEIDQEVKRLIEPLGQIVPKEGADAAVEIGDYVIVDVTMKEGDKQINEFKEAKVRVQKQLALRDGRAENFGKELSGAKVGDQRLVKIKMGSNVAADVQGRIIDAIFTIKEIKTVRYPELTPQQLEELFGVSNEEQLREFVESLLNRRFEYAQRNSYRQQILAQFAAAANLELPRDLLVRQAKRTLARRVMEMRNAGMTDEQIEGRRRVLEQDAIAATATSLKEHFILQKIAEVEKIEINDEDIDEEIERIAEQSNESPRKVRARLEKDDLIETLATELLERRALDLVLQNAVYQDVDWKDEDEEGDVATVASEAVPGSTASTPVS